MARTRQTARPSTGGIAPRRQLCTGRCHLRQQIEPRNVGIWNENLIKRTFPTWSRPDIPKKASSTIPVFQPRTSPGVKPRSKRWSFRPGDWWTSTKDVSLLGPDLVSRLPTELLIQILEHLVPIGNIFHFAKTYVSDLQLVCCHVSTQYIIHQVCLSSKDPTIALSDLASVCRRWRDVTYEIFYRENQFVFEVSACPYPMQVQLPNTWSDLTCTSWSRSTASAQKHLGLPLSPSIGRWLRDVTIRIALCDHSDDVVKRAWKSCRCLLEEVRTLGACLNGQGESRGLARLAIAVSVRNWGKIRDFLEPVRLQHDSHAACGVRMECPGLVDIKLSDLSEEHRGYVREVFATLSSLPVAQTITYGGILTGDLIQMCLEPRSEGTRTEMPRMPSTVVKTAVEKTRRHINDNGFEGDLPLAKRLRSRR